ncbi:MAG: outer membrane lipoprotein chaperone LolA [Pseudomonadota bacterium]
MKILPVIAFAACLLPFTAFADDAEDALRERGAQTLREFQNNVRTYAADFSQASYDADGGLKEQSSGVAIIKRPGKFAWIYRDPYENHLIADGTNLWSWDLDLDSVNVREQKGALGQSPAQILSGNTDALEAFDYHGASEQDGVLVVQLASRSQESDFRVMRLAFNAGVLVAMRIGDNLGQTTDIQFTDVRMNTEIDESVFDFVIPEGADVVGTPIRDSTESAGDADEAPETDNEVEDSAARMRDDTPPERSATPIVSGLG